MLIGMCSTLSAARAAGSARVATAALPSASVARRVRWKVAAIMCGLPQSVSTVGGLSDRTVISDETSGQRAPPEACDGPLKGRQPLMYIIATGEAGTQPPQREPPA